MLRQPIRVILIVTGITAIFACFIPGLSFQTTIYDLIIDDITETERYQKLKEVFGSNEIIRVVIKSDNIFDPATFQKISALAETAKEIEGVERVVSLPDIKNSFDISNKWSLKEFADVIDGADLFNKNLISEDHKTTALTLVLKNDVSQESVIQYIENRIIKQDKHLSLYQIGMPLVSSALAQFTKKDFMRLPVVTFFLIAITLLLMYRKIAYALLPILCVLFSLIWTFGLMSITGIPLSILTMIIPVFLIAVGTAYCLHTVSEYLSAVTIAKTPQEATVLTFSKVTFPTTLAVLTTIIGLSSLFLNRISAIKEFAVVSCLGIFSFVILLLTLLPAIMAIIPLPEKSEDNQSRMPGKKTGFIDRLIDKIIILNLYHQRKALLIIGAVVLFCTFGLFQIHIETNPVDYFKKDTQVSQNFHDIYKDLSGSFPLNVVMKSKEEDFFENPNHVAEIEKLQRFLESLPGVDKTISFADYMQLVNYSTNRFDKNYYALPEEAFEVRMLINSYKTILGEDMLTPFMNADFSETNILLLTHISSSRDFLSIRDKILDHVYHNFSRNIDWDITGFGMAISASNQQLASGQMKSLLLTIFMIFVIMFTLFLSFKVGLIAIVPNLFPIIINFGIMGWFGIELSMATSLIASIAIGLAVDDTIHYLVRYNHEFRKDLDEKRALKDTLTHIGKPIIMTTITISLGFSILGFSSFKPTAVFGVMMVITMVSALVADLILLPSMILHINLVTVWDLVRLKMGTEPRFGIPLFKGLSRIQVHYIMMAGMLKKINPGEALFYKAEQSDSMYAIISGKLEVFDHEISKNKPPSRTIEMRKMLAKLKSGDIVGEMGLLRSAPRSATVIASEKSELLHINWKMIKRLHWLSPPAASKFNTNLLTILCDRIDRATRNLFLESTVDDLTGLNNRKGFLRILEMETIRSRRYNGNFALCLFRIGFGSSDDRMNPDNQHIIIRDVSRIISEKTRESDSLGRISHQTFALLMPRNAMEDSKNLARRYRQSLLDYKEFYHHSITVNAHLALSGQLNESDQTGEMLLFEAEEKINRKKI